jgi:hypothetical protein
MHLSPSSNINLHPGTANETANPTLVKKVEMRHRNLVRLYLSLPSRKERLFPHLEES